MEVKIKNEVYQYRSDYPDGWKFSKGDYFKFPVAVGPTTCFIKRFEKRAENIAGWSLVQNLTTEFHESLSNVYDVISVIECNKIVHYFFFEFVEGQTLYDCIIEKAELDLERFTIDLFNALQTLQRNAHWFPDFCEKNIFCGKNGRFLLIDLDSAQPLSDLPNTDIWGSKEYWALVFDYCRNILNYKEFLPSEFNGASLNYLNVIFLVLRLKLYYADPEAEFDSATIYNQLPLFLYNIFPPFNEIFNKVYQNKEHLLSHQEVLQIKDLVLHKIVNISGSWFKESIEGHCVSIPIIDNFSVENYMISNHDNYIVENGKHFTLQWDVRNGHRIEVYRDGQPFKIIKAGERSIEIIENVFNASEKLIEYNLVVWGSDVSIESAKRLSLNVTIKNNTFVERDPLITGFTVRDYIEKKQDTYIVESGRTFILAWSVNNAMEIEIHKDGACFKKIPVKENKLKITETIYDCKQKTIVYLLIASAGLKKAQSELLITVKDSVAALPVIDYFQSNKYKVASGGSFVLSWEVQNTTEVILLKNGEFCKKIDPDVKKITFEKNYENEKKSIEYTLQASNVFGEINSKPISIIIKPPIRLLKTAIFIGIALILLLSLYYLIHNIMGIKNRIPPQTTIIDIAKDTTNQPGKDPSLNNRPNRTISSKTAGHQDTITIKSPKEFPALQSLSVDPLMLPFVEEGTTITISGKNFPKKNSAVSVKFNDNMVPGKVLNQTILSALVPSLETNHVKIEVIIGKKVFKVSDYLIYKPTHSYPVVVKTFTENVVTEGFFITLAVNYLNKDDKVMVLFNNTPVPLNLRNPTNLRVQVPSLEKNINIINIFVVINGMSWEVGHNIKYKHTN